MSETPRYSLLHDPIVSVRSPGRTNRRRLILPELYSALAHDGEVGDFPAVAAHQRQSWHAFLVQIAAMALHKAGETGVVHSAERWRELLLELVDQRESAFALVENDLSKPALLQPPVPESSIDGWTKVATPDALDIMVASKVHDVKAARAAGAGPEDWLLALVSLQTMQGFSGNTLNGIGRMNSGYGSRPEVSLTPSLVPGPRFLRDVEVLLATRSDVVATYEYAESDGHTLLWLLPWDGTDSLAVGSCDPYFVEICRRVRFTAEDGELRCFYRGTKSLRLDAKQRKGVLGDPWTPIDAGGEKSLTVSGEGFTYDKTQKLIWGSDYQRPATQLARPEDPSEMFFTARVLVRGNKTEGFHQRLLLLPKSVRRRLAKPEGSTQLSEIASAWVSHSATMKAKVLKPALLNLVQGGPEKLNFKDSRVDPFLDRYEARVDQRFFDALFEALETAGDDLSPLKEIGSVWGEVLVAIGTEVLDEAIGRASVSSPRHYRAVTAARRTFFGAARNNGFPRRHAETAATEVTE